MATAMGRGEAWRGFFRGNAFLREALPILLLTAAGGLFAGVVFSGMEEALAHTPGLIVLVPALIGLRGNINSALGSRLGSAAHLGLIEPESLWGDEVQANVLGSLALSTLVSAFAGASAWATTRMLGLPSAGLHVLVAIALLAGFASGILLALVTVLIVKVAFFYGIDPDNVTGPALATVGDVITLLMLFGSAVLLGGLGGGGGGAA